VELYYHPPFADDGVGIKILTFSKYGILPSEMTEKNLLLLDSIFTLHGIVENVTTSHSDTSTPLVASDFTYIFLVTPIS
jgi:pyrroline-5-carboxylate reductase